MAAADITALANKFYAAQLAVRDQLDAKFKAALFGAEGASSTAWGLALVLASWRRQKAGDSLSDVADTGVLTLIGQIKNFEGAFPGSFAKFLDTAEAATDVGKIAGAGSYFLTTVNELGAFVRPGLLSWLSSPGFANVAGALRNKLGGPNESTKAPSTAPVNRTRSFDQGDFRPKIASPVAEPPRQVEPPRQSERDMQLALLIRAGWSKEQAEQILAGPGGARMQDGPAKPTAPDSPTAKTGPDKPPVVDGKTILDRAGGDKQATSTTSEAGGIPGAIKSGVDLLREILKLATSSGSDSKGTPGGNGKGNGKSEPGYSYPPPETGGEEPPDYMPTGGAGDSSTTPPPVIINDSSEVID